MVRQSAHDALEVWRAPEHFRPSRKRGTWPAPPTVRPSDPRAMPRETIVLGAVCGLASRVTVVSWFGALRRKEWRHTPNPVRRSRGSGSTARIHGSVAGVSRMYRAVSRLFREYRAGYLSSIAAVSRSFAAVSRSFASVAQAVSRVSRLSRAVSRVSRAKSRGWMETRIAFQWIMYD